MYTYLLSLFVFLSGIGWQVVFAVRRQGHIHVCLHVASYTYPLSRCLYTYSYTHFLSIYASEWRWVAGRVRRQTSPPNIYTCMPVYIYEYLSSIYIRVSEWCWVTGRVRRQTAPPTMYICMPVYI